MFNRLKDIKIVEYICYILVFNIIILYNILILIMHGLSIISLCSLLIPKYITKSFVIDSHVLLNFVFEKWIKLIILFDFSLPGRTFEVFIDLYNVLEVVKSEFSSTHIQNELRQKIKFHVNFWGKSDFCSISSYGYVFNNEEFVF